MTVKVLVADDSVTIQKVVKLAFADEDVVVEAVSDGHAALESLQHFNPDIVLADVFMPGLSGYEVCEHIKDEPALKHIPLILLAGTFEPFDQAEAARVRSDGYLTKPFDTEELLNLIRTHVGDKILGPVQTGVEDGVRRNPPKLGRQVTAAAVESFLGETRILDVFDPALSLKRTAHSADTRTSHGADLPEGTLNHIVDRVIRKMSPDVIREVAWEVVPELSETIIRQTIKDRE
jgi:CheY-like chemotaxis protein